MTPTTSLNVLPQLLLSLSQPGKRSGASKSKIQCGALWIWPELSRTWQPSLRDPKLGRFPTSSGMFFSSHGEMDLAQTFRYQTKMVICHRDENLIYNRAISKFMIGLPSWKAENQIQPTHMDKVRLATSHLFIQFRCSSHLTIGVFHHSRFNSHLKKHIQFHKKQPLKKKKKTPFWVNEQLPLENNVSVAKFLKAQWWRRRTSRRRLPRSCKGCPRDPWSLGVGSSLGRLLRKNVLVTSWMLIRKTSRKRGESCQLFFFVCFEIRKNSWAVSYTSGA